MRAPRSVARLVGIIGASALPLLGSACSTEIIDDWGVAGYARIHGIAVAANGTPFTSGFVMCGATAPDTFGREFQTDSTGAFDVTLEAPGALPLPADSILQCRVRAPGGAPSVVTADVAVPFTKSRANRVATEVVLDSP